MCESRNFVILQVYGSSYAELGIILQCTYIAIHCSYQFSLALSPPALQHSNSNENKCYGASSSVC